MMCRKLSAMSAFFFFFQDSNCLVLWQSQQNDFYALKIKRICHRDISFLLKHCPCPGKCPLGPWSQTLSQNSSGINEGLACCSHQDKKKNACSLEHTLGCLEWLWYKCSCRTIDFGL